MRTHGKALARRIHHAGNVLLREARRRISGSSRDVSVTAAAAAPPPAPEVVSSPLYTHEAHPHVPQHPLQVYHQRRRARAARSRIHAFNEWLAVWITEHTGTMACAYLFLGIGLGSLIGYFTNNIILASIFGAVSSYVLQLVLLPIIQLGTSIQGQKQEVAIDQSHRNTVKLVHEQTQVMKHLAAQDEQLVALQQHLVEQDAHILAILQGLERLPAALTPQPAKRPRPPRANGN
jgi:hypothetical protein